MTMPYAEYEALPGLRWSTLKNVGDSMLHFAHARDNGGGDTQAMFIGRAVHCAVFEPDELPLRYVVWKGGDKRGAAWTEFKAANPDAEILKQCEYERCLAIRDAVHNHPAAGRLLTGESEVVKQWTDADTGLACKCRIDHLTDSMRIDLKTTTTIDKRLFEISAAKYQYHGQDAFYGRSDAALRDLPSGIIAVESEAPYDVAVFVYSDFARSYGDGLVSEYLRAVKACEASGQWPGRYEGVQELCLPAWMENEADDTGLGITIGGERS